MLPESVEKDATAIESVRLRLVKAMAWCATGIFIVLLFGARSVLAASADTRWQLGLQIGLLATPPMVVLCWGVLFLKRRYASAGATPDQRAHVERYLAWRRAYCAWLEESRRVYRLHLTPAQRQRLDVSYAHTRKRMPSGSR